MTEQIIDDPILLRTGESLLLLLDNLRKEMLMGRQVCNGLSQKKDNLAFTLRNNVVSERGRLHVVVLGVNDSLAKRVSVCVLLDPLGQCGPPRILAQDFGIGKERQRLGLRGLGGKVVNENLQRHVDVRLDANLE